MRCAAFALLLCLAAAPARALDVPYLSGRVVDNAEILSPGARERIAQQLKAHEDATGNQIAVLTVPSLEGESVEDFAVRVFEDWKLGRQGQDNGVLVVVAPQDRRMRIEVGYGLEGTLTDVAAARIIRDVMTPHFKAGDFDGGIEQGVQTIIQVLAGEAADGAAAPAEAGTQSELFQGPLLSGPERILMGGFIFGIIGLFTIIGILTPGVGWFMYLFLIPFWSMFPIVIVGADHTLKILIAYLVAYPLLKLVLPRTEWYQRASKAMGTKGGGFGGFSVGYGGGSWSSRASGGGFSGGGGRSGGGGSSGSW
ncbi:MAG TPA: TPM domain-containing protein [Nevskiales bacterium]|nr:TPM domain-containing protein [Nevskiales bacterium]